MRFAYADPPYPGMAKRYKNDPSGLASEVNFQLLIAYLNSDFDAWAMSLHSNALKQILPLCPDDVRIAAWCKPFAYFKVNVNPGYTWEPVLFRGGRKYTRESATVRDHLLGNIVLKANYFGAKPQAFCFWLFTLLNARVGDDFEDVFPGSGAVSAAWDVWQRQGRMFA